MTFWVEKDRHMHFYSAVGVLYVSVHFYTFTVRDHTSLDDLTTLTLIIGIGVGRRLETRVGDTLGRLSCAL